MERYSLSVAKTKKAVGKMKGKKIAIGIISVAILLVALTVTIIDAAGVIDLWTHPILNFLFVIAAGFGLMAIVIGFTYRSAFTDFIGIIVFSLAIIYVLVQYFVWWLGLTAVITFIAIMSVISRLYFGNHADFALNNDENYKTFEERKAEEKAKAESEGKAEEKRELPKIKSFKD